MDWRRSFGASYPQNFRLLGLPWACRGQEEGRKGCEKSGEEGERKEDRSEEKMVENVRNKDQFLGKI